MLQYHRLVRLSTGGHEWRDDYFDASRKRSNTSSIFKVNGYCSGKNGKMKTVRVLIVSFVSDRWERILYPAKFCRRTSSVQVFENKELWWEMERGLIRG